jgi:hypothetical protein
MCLKNLFPYLTNHIKQKLYIKVIWRNRNIEDILVGTKKELKDREWLLAKSVFQGVNPLNKAITEVSENGIKLCAIEKTINDSLCYRLTGCCPKRSKQ